MELQAISAVVSIIANAYQLGNNLVNLYVSLRDTRAEVNERIVHVRNHWYRLKEQLDFVERAGSCLGEDLLAMHEQSLKVLVSKLTSATLKANGLLKAPKRTVKDPGARPEVRRLKYIFVKGYLDDTIRSLDRWQKLYDPSWHLIIRIADPLIDQELSKARVSGSVEEAPVLRTARNLRVAVRETSPRKVPFLKSNSLNNGRIRSISYSSAKHVQVPESSGWFITDPIPCPAGSYAGNMDKDIRNLATKLQYSDPSTFGVLKCNGVIRVRDECSNRLISFDLVFETLSSEIPYALRSCLVQRTPHTLTQRLEVAKQLARAVNYVHTLDFVHKNVRPENFIGFGGGDNNKIGDFYLIGFEQVRSADGMTYYHGDQKWYNNIYRHPSRQGPYPEESYRMQHDIYSLGVCLLEIGLWETFVLHKNDRKVPNAALLDVSAEDLGRQSPLQRKNVLVGVARRKLPAVVGELYTEVVVNCLTCLDKDNIDFGDETEFEDADGVAVGVRYIEKVLLKLNSISI